MFSIWWATSYIFTISRECRWRSKSILLLKQFLLWYNSHNIKLQLYSVQSSGFQYIQNVVQGFPGGTSSKEPTCQCRRCKGCGFNPWVGKIPWRRAWQPTPILLPGESPWTEEPGGLQSIGSQSQTWQKQLSMHAHSKSFFKRYLNFCRAARLSSTAVATIL